MHTSNRSGFRHCSRQCRRNQLEPPCTDPYARWCGRGRRATAAPMPINQIIGIEIDITAVPTLKSAFPTNASSPIVIQGAATTPSIPSPVLIYPGPTYANPNGRAVIFTNNVRVDLPTTMAVLTPYFVAGGGVASVRRSADLTFRYPL